MTKTRKSSTKFVCRAPPLLALSFALALILVFSSARAQEADAERSPAQTGRPAVRTLTTDPAARIAPVESNEDVSGAPGTVPTAHPRTTDDSGLRRLPVPQTEVAIIPHTSRNEFSLMGGLSLNGNGDIDRGTYEHKIGQSPVLKAGYHIAFFARHPFNLLVGAEFIYMHSTEVASSSLATATYTADIIDGGPTIGIAWSPLGPGSAFQLQAKLGIGLTLSRSSQLKSPGFTTSISQTDTSNGTIVAFWQELFGVYCLTPHVRLMAGFTNAEDTTAIITGAAYAF